MSLIADCFDVLLVGSDGKMFGSTTLSSGDINITCDSTQIRAGRGDALIAILRGNKQAEINLSEVTLNWDFLAMQLGKAATTGATNVYALPQWYECVDLDGAGAGTAIGFKLKNTPLASGSGLKIFNSSGIELATPAGYTISGDTVTIVGGTVGQAIEVRGYLYTTDASASTIEIDSVSFPDDVKCILETIEISEEGETQLAKVQYIFDKAVPTGNVSISTKKEKDANITDFSLLAIKPRTSNRIGRVVRIPISAS